MAIRTELRRGVRRLVIDIRYTRADGSAARFRRDADVQTITAARAEERRRLVQIAQCGSPWEPGESPSGDPSEPTPAPHSVNLHLAPAPGPAPTFATVAKEFLGTFAMSHLKPSTRIGYGKVIDSFLVPRIGDLPITAIDANVARRLDAELAERGVRASTRHNVQTILRSVVRRYAVEAGYLPQAPAFPRMKTPGATVLRVLTTEQIKEILRVANTAHRRAFLLGADAGLRAGEIRGLRWRDVDFDQNRIIVRENICHGISSTPKSGHERVVPLTPALRAELEITRPRPREQLVALDARGEAYTNDSLGKAFNRVMTRAGLEGWSLHDLRHYFVTTLFRAGVPAPTVQALAGHADLATTQRYAHVIALDLQQAIGRLAAVSAGQQRGQQMGNGAGNGSGQEVGEKKIA